MIALQNGNLVFIGAAQHDLARPCRRDKLEGNARRKATETLRLFRRQRLQVCHFHIADKLHSTCTEMFLK